MLVSYLLQANRLDAPDSATANLRATTRRLRPWLRTVTDQMPTFLASKTPVQLTVWWPSSQHRTGAGGLGWTCLESAHPVSVSAHLWYHHVSSLAALCCDHQYCEFQQHILLLTSFQCSCLIIECIEALIWLGCPQFALPLHVQGLEEPPFERVLWWNSSPRDVHKTKSFAKCFDCFLKVTPVLLWKHAIHLCCCPVQVQLHLVEPLLWCPLTYLRPLPQLLNPTVKPIIRDFSPFTSVHE